MFRFGSHVNSAKDSLLLRFQKLPPLWGSLLCTGTLFHLLLLLFFGIGDLERHVIASDSLEIELMGTPSSQRIQELSLALRALPGVRQVSYRSAVQRQEITSALLQNHRLLPDSLRHDSLLLRLESTAAFAYVTQEIGQRSWRGILLPDAFRVILEQEKESRSALLSLHTFRSFISIVLISSFLLLTLLSWTSVSLSQEKQQEMTLLVLLGSLPRHLFFPLAGAFGRIALIIFLGGSLFALLLFALGFPLLDDSWKTLFLFHRSLLLLLVLPLPFAAIAVSVSSGIASLWHHRRLLGSPLPFLS